MLDAFGSSSAHQTSALVGRAQGGITLGPERGELDADFTWRGSSSLFSEFCLCIGRNVAHLNTTCLPVKNSGSRRTLIFGFIPSVGLAKPQFPPPLQQDDTFACQ
jgi:hypothetical protein